jgi:hypothetical protein
MDGFPFDARHTFKVNHLTDIERYAELDEKYVEPKADEYQPRVCLRLSRESPISKFTGRNISELGWAIPKVVTNMRLSVGMRLRSIGTGNRPNAS